MRTTGPWISGLLGAALLAGAAQAQQVRPGAESGVGLTGADVPQLLKDIKADPYKQPGQPICDTVPLEIQQITDLIGPDLNTQATADDKSLASRGADVARGLVPYRGVVRFVTGANKKDEELREAIMAGYARRGFLRGIQLNLKCHPEPTPVADPSPAAKPARKAHPAKKS
jgi:hypothetical protein